MKNISKVAVVGSSFEGHEVMADVFGKLKLGKESVVILIPHICAEKVYESLLGKRKKVYSIFDNQVIEPGSIYVGMENFDTGFNGLRRKMKIKNKNKEYRFSLGKEKIEGGYISEAFSAVAKTFGEKSMGVILYGIGGDGINGLKKIKEADGITITQKVDASMPHFEGSMPYFAMKHCEIDYVIPSDKLYSKLEEMLG